MADNQPLPPASSEDSNNNSTTANEDSTDKSTPAASTTEEKEYTAASVQDAWNNHFAAFGSQDLDRIVKDYTEESVLECYDAGSNKRTKHVGLAAIRAFFSGLFQLLTDLSTLSAPVIEVTEQPFKQVYLCWSCSSSGVTFAHDTFFFDEHNKIIRQNIGCVIEPKKGHE